jgi:hypothetical protein
VYVIKSKWGKEDVRTKLSLENQKAILNWIEVAEDMNP